MKVKDDEKFIKIVEGLVSPAEVCTIFFFNSMRRLLPRGLFKKLLNRTSRKTPYMGFIIEPYSLFFFFRLKDVEKAKSLLPDRYELTKARIYEEDEPGYYFGMGIFNTRASTFWGTRLESYLIARDKKTGLLSWIFIDIVSDTIIASPREGVADPNALKAIYTTSARGELFVDFEKAVGGRCLQAKGSLKQGRFRRLEQELWITGNNSVAHSKELMDKDDDPFAVIFDPAEVDEALELPVEDFKISLQSMVPDFAEPELCQTACFPYTQHYIADSPGCRTFVKSPEDMVEIYNEISRRTDLKTFSAKGIKHQFFFGIGATFVAAVIMFILLMIQ